ncbi:MULTISPECIES: hypothetical protein [Pseudomonas]|uniref:hypothetical protein n=1 Tax=Pseudomonas TaxID=286 RepID=UPI0018E6E163|nr:MULTISPECIES: hypothetical protein [Pseudomonas]MBJ2214125.1 hypothetical protein [Pseudomonas carnis]MBP5947993.1 hypothetical protein [Pseudomonas sp. P9(2020)]
MNHDACIEDLFAFERDRASHICGSKGSMDGFQSGHGRLLMEMFGTDTSLQAHLVKPSFHHALAMSSTNRQRLADTFRPESEIAHRAVTEADINKAKAFVSELLQIDVSDVRVVLAPQMVMQPKALGTVYSSGAVNHVVVIPESTYDPEGLLVRQLAIAGHYIGMRRAGGLATMISDGVSQAMVGHFAATRYAMTEPSSTSMTFQQQMLVYWEFAKGLSYAATDPLAFIASDHGAGLMQDYGADMFQAVIADLYASMTNGRAIWFGDNSFVGAALAIANIENHDGIRRFIATDRGDRTLDARLSASIAGYSAEQVLGFNNTLSTLIS